MALTLPPGETQFLDDAGNPLVGGFVFHYIPGTSTPRDTFQDINATILNTNPVILDAGGRAVIFGTGAYRQVLTDSLGNQIYDQVTQVATLALLGGVALSGATMTGTLTVPNLSVTGGQGLTIAPTANPSIPTIASLNVQGSTQSTTQREFLAAFGFTSTLGDGLTGGNQDRVTLYSGMDMQAGSGDAWSLNTVLTMEAAATATANAIGHELDFNNLQGNRGETVGGGGFAAPAAYGLAVTGAGSFRSTAAHLVSGPGGSAIWNRGIAFVNGSVQQATFQDFTSAVTSVEILGSHTYGVDMKDGVFSGAGIRIGNGTFIKARDAGDTADLALLVQSGANVILGDAATTGIYSRNIFAPFTDNTVSSGSNTNRWTAVWAVNGAIQTSDPDLKTDIESLTKVPTGDILDRIEPISFRWTDGGFDEVEVTEEVEEPVTEASEWEETITEMRAGVATLMKVKRVNQVPVYDEHDCVNPDGTPAMIVVEAVPATFDRQGRLVRHAQPGRTFRATHREPRMQKVQRQVKKLVPRAGKRVHWGFNAAEVAEVATIAGKDFGGFVRAEDGTLAIRPDQLLPIMWEEVRRLRTRVAELEGRKS